MITRIASLLLATLLTITGAAVTYTVDWWTVDSGGGISSGGNISIEGTIGQPDASVTTLSGGDYSVDGGFWGWETGADPAWGGYIYMPVIQHRPCQADPSEREPNNNLSEANHICLSAAVIGLHDGAAGTGDLFYVQIHSAAGAHITLNTADAIGVQLLVYELDGDTLKLLVQDAVEPFDIVMETTTVKTYYVYVYSDPGALNSAQYSLQVVNSAKGRALDEPAQSALSTPPPPPR